MIWARDKSSNKLQRKITLEISTHFGFVNTISRIKRKMQIGEPLLNVDEHKLNAKKNVIWPIFDIRKWFQMSINRHNTGVK